MNNFIEDFLNTKEAIQYTKVCADKLREARDTNQLPYHKIGRVIIYERIHLKAWVLSSELHIDGKIKKK